MQFVVRGEGRYGAPTNLRTYVVPLLLTLLAFFVPSDWLIWIFIIFGQGHFLMSFFYQYKAGKIRIAYLLILAALLAVFAGYVLIFGEQAFLAFLLIAFLFPIHFAKDEFTLYGSSLEKRHLLHIVLFTAITFGATLSLFSDFALMARVVLWGSGVLFAILILAELLRHRSFVTRAEYYVWTVGVLLLLLALLGRPEQVLSCLIILHGFNWLASFAYRVGDAPEAKKEFWTAFWVTHGFGLLGFFAFLHLSIPALKYFFMLLYYDFWALAHVTLTALPFKTQMKA